MASEQKQSDKMRVVFGLILGGSGIVFLSWLAYLSHKSGNKGKV